MNGLRRVKELLGSQFIAALDAQPADSVEEIRLRVGEFPTVLISGEERVLLARRTSAEELARILERATGASLHAVADAIAAGYLSYKGVRIGVCGTVVQHQGIVRGFQHFSALALRVPGAYPGIMEPFAAELTRDWKNTLLIAPPGGGKTTALRELIRSLSEKGKRVSVIDDRNELSASEGGIAQFALGAHTDVLVGAEKAKGALLLLRSMNPQILAMDEVSAPEDAHALLTIWGCGVGILACAHASSLAELRQREIYCQLLDKRVFQKLLIIDGVGKNRRYQMLSLSE